MWLTHREPATSVAADHMLLQPLIRNQPIPHPEPPPLSSLHCRLLAPGWYGAGVAEQDLAPDAFEREQLRHVIRHLTQRVVPTPFKQDMSRARFQR